MTNVVFYKNGDNYYGFSLSGHTGYAEYGKDIVCASLSSISQSTLMGLTKVLDIKCGVERNDEKGVLKIRLPKDLGHDKLALAQVLFETMFLSIKELENGYPSNIKMEVRKL